MPWSLPMGPRVQSTCGHLKWSRGLIVTPAETLNRLGSFKEPHTGIIGRESEVSPCGELGALVRRLRVKAGGGHFLIQPGWILFKFPLMRHHCGPIVLPCVLNRKVNLHITVFQRQLDPLITLVTARMLKNEMEDFLLSSNFLFSKFFLNKFHE